MSLVCLFFSFTSQAFAGDSDPNAPDTKLPSRITYQLSEDGFGSHLMSYIHAKWISYTNKIPLLYKPFPYANQLKLHEEEQRYDESRKKTWEQAVTIKQENEVHYMDPSKTLYIVPFFKEPVGENLYRKDPARFEIDWNDQNFKKILQEACTPLKSVDTLKIPKGHISVAVHVRRMQGTETTALRKEIMLKFPSEAYYMKQIQRIYKTFQGMPLFVYVFTNAPNPGELVNLFERELKLPNVIYACRPSGNHAKSGVLEDFINMSKFDCLIRPESSLSIAAEAIGNHKIVIKPISAIWNPNFQCAAIQKIHVKVNNQKPKKKDKEKKESKWTITAG